MILDFDSTSLWWQKMTRSERVCALKELGLVPDLAKYDWDWLSDDEQQELARFRVLSALGMPRDPLSGFVEVAR